MKKKIIKNVLNTRHSLRGRGHFKTILIFFNRRALHEGNTWETQKLKYQEYKYFSAKRNYVHRFKNSCLNLKVDRMVNLFTKWGSLTNNYIYLYRSHFIVMR